MSNISNDTNAQDTHTSGVGRTLPNLFGLTLKELTGRAKALGLKPYAGKQLAEWLYTHRVTSFEQMTNLSKSARAALSEHYTIERPTYIKVEQSSDGTRKYLFPAAGRFVEAAYIPDKDRATLCISSQVGCKMGCLFCMTARQGFQDNLSSGEIVNQVLGIEETESLTNIVYMGMGEPLDNLDEVLKSTEVLTADWGLGMSSQRITVSTIGILPAMETFLQSSPVRFALSLHSPFPDERRKLMPSEHAYPMDELLSVLKRLEDGRKRRVSIEYIMFDGINDTESHAKELVRLLEGIRVRVNLIPFHPIPGTPLKSCPPDKMQAFAEMLKKRGLFASVRRSRGMDISAACGLLSTKALSRRDVDPDF